MGVPKFYRWLSERYPLINQELTESSMIPEIDNLYLDMNGTIHNVTHGNDLAKAQKITDVAIAVLRAIDANVKMIRPTKVLYLAVDGVAPRAKMNQQRSRRFRAAKDLQEQVMAAKQSGELAGDEEAFDSNCITPGTEFMTELGIHLQYLLRRQIREDPVWQRFEVIFSGHEVPGEGEHKIMDYIRAMKMQPNYNPNTRHCLVGLDADLVMLSLATHEPHIFLLRNQVDFSRPSMGLKSTKNATVNTEEGKWQLLHLSILREYLEMDLRPAPEDLESMGFEYDGERIIDDFVLLMCLCGNDFIPHLPSLDIGEGAVEKLMAGYRETLPTLGGYLTHGHKVNLGRVEVILRLMGEQEEEVLEERRIDQARFAKRRSKNGYKPPAIREREASQLQDEDSKLALAASMASVSWDHARALVHGETSKSSSETPQSTETPTAAKQKKRVHVAAGPPEMAMKGFAAGRGRPMGAGASTSGVVNGAGGSESKGSEFDDDDDDFQPVAPRSTSTDSPVVIPDDLQGPLLSNVGIGAVDDKVKYYAEKFGISYDDVAIHHKIRKSFLEAILWVMEYYYQGVPSWGWFYPFHYAPMTSDLVGLEQYDISFELGEPFTPFMQLLGCLPGASAHLVPKCFGDLMTRPNSPIKHFYPEVQEVKIDPNGKHAPWEGVVLIPFVKEDELVDAVNRYCPPSKMTPAERKRNEFGKTWRFRYDPSMAETLRSTHPTAYLDITPSRSTVEVFELPALPPGGFVPAPPQGCSIPAPGFPSLHTRPLSPYIDMVNMHVFNRPSRLPSVVLRIGDGLMLSPDTWKDPNTPEMHEIYSPKFSVPYRMGTTVRVFKENMDPLRGGATCAMPMFKSANVTAKHLLGRVVYAKWPHLIEGLVVSVSDDQHEIRLPQAAVSQLSSAPIPLVAWTTLSDQILRRSLSGGVTLPRAGIEIAPPRVLVRIRCLVGMRRHPETGSLYRVFAPPNSDGDIVTSLQLICARSPCPEQRLQPQILADVSQYLPQGTPVVVLRGPQTGSVGEVVGYEDKDGNQYVKVEAKVAPPEPPLAQIVLRSVKENYFSIDDIANVCNVPVPALSCITGSLVVKVGRHHNDTTDIGLNLHNPAKAFLPGYSRPVFQTHTTAAWGADRGLSAAQKDALSTRMKGITWEFSPKAIQVLRQYLERFPDIRRLARKAAGRGHVFLDEVGGPEALDAILNFLTHLDTNAMSLVPVSSTIMPKPAVASVVKGYDEYHAELKRRSAEGESKGEGSSGEQQMAFLRTETLVVPPSALFRRDQEGWSVGCIGSGIVANTAAATGGPTQGAGVVAGQDRAPQLGDRVVNLSQTRAPLGARGTVIAVHAGTGFVEIVFDEAFVGGTSLHGRCPEGRGLLVEWSHCLSLTAAGRTGASGGALMASGSSQEGGEGLSAMVGEEGGGSKSTEQQLQEQLEYYFSDRNLVKDDFLRSKMDKFGWVPFHIIGNFPLVKRLARNNLKAVESAARASSSLQVSDDGSRVRRSKPFHPPANQGGGMRPTVLAGKGAKHSPRGGRQQQQHHGGRGGGSKDMAPSVSALFSAAAPAPAPAAQGGGGGGGSRAPRGFEAYQQQLRAASQGGPPAGAGSSSNGAAGKASTAGREGKKDDRGKFDSFFGHLMKK